MIKIIREKDHVDRYRNYRIFIDGEYSGNIKRGETKTYNLTEGKHTIYVKIDWCRSNKVNVIEKSDQEIILKTGNSVKWYLTPLMFLYLTFLKNKYLWLKKM